AWASLACRPSWSRRRRSWRATSRPWGSRRARPRCWSSRASPEPVRRARAAGRIHPQGFGKKIEATFRGAPPMRAPLAILLVVLLALPATSALPLPPPTAPPAAHATFDRTAYRAQVDKAVQFALGYQKPDGGVYEYAFLLKDQDASLALKLLAGSETLPVRGSNLSALIHYFESVQGVDGSFGSGSTVPTVTTQAIDGLLDAGYDQGSTAMTRAFSRPSASSSPARTGPAAASRRPPASSRRPPRRRT